MKKIIGIFILFLFIFQMPMTISKDFLIDGKIIIENENYQLFDGIDYSKYGNFTLNDNGIIKTDDGWYYYPPYPNYAPSGMPDFSGVQQPDWYHPDIEDRDNGIGCSTIAFANIIWYMDSMFSDINGTPGDGLDIFNLVEDYNAPSSPNPGPLTDDHNFNNVNDPLSLWDSLNNIYGNELIERIRMYTGPGYATEFEAGLVSFIEDLNLSKYLRVEAGYFSKNQAPSLDDFVKYVKKGAALVIGLDWYGNNIRIGGHSVSLSGVNKNNSLIAISDSSKDFSNPTNNKFLHNNPLYISHDIYEVVETSRFNRPVLEIIFWSPYEESEICYIEDFFCIVPNKNQPNNPILHGETNG